MKKLKRFEIIILFMVIPFSLVFGESSVDRILNKDKALREELKRKDEERRARILKKFEDFKKRVENFAPGMKLKLPVGLDHAQDIGKLDADAKIMKSKEYFAWAAESYKLRALPYDSIKEYTATIRRSEKVIVLMKPKVAKSRKYKSITRDWMLIKNSKGVQGYIPRNLLLRKKPQKKGMGFGMGDEYDYRAPVDNGMFVLSQFNIGGDSVPENSNNSREQKGEQMQVNTSVLNIRYSAGMSSAVSGKLYRGDLVRVLEYTSYYDYYNGIRARWARISADGMTGWVFSYYLVKPGSQPVNKKPDYISYLEKGKSLYVKSDILRVRDAPDDLGIVLFSLENRKRVEITDIEDEEITLGGKKSKWVQIKFEDYEGWVFGAFLSEDRNAKEEGDDINNLFQVPIEDGSFRISSKFGKRILNGRVNNHTGVDLAAACRTKVMAAADGTVILVVHNNRNCSSCGYGNYVILQHKNGFRSVYGHLTSISVRNGAKISSGDKVGTVGNTGHSYGCHLHFEIRAYEEFVDPLKYIHP